MTQKLVNFDAFLVGKVPKSSIFNRDCLENRKNLKSEKSLKSKKAQIKKSYFCGLQKSMLWTNKIMSETRVL